MVLMGLLIPTLLWAWTGEVVGIADRVIVLSNGRVTGEFDGHAVSEQELVEASYVGHTTDAGGQPRED